MPYGATSMDSAILSCHEAFKASEIMETNFPFLKLFLTGIWS